MLFSYVSGQQQIDNNKKCRQIADGFMIAMQMRWYDVGRIAQWSTSRASLEATGCHHREKACAVLPRQPPWSTSLLKQH